MAKSPDQQGFTEDQSAYQSQPDAPQHWTLKVAPDGRFVIPAAARAAMEIGDEGRVTAILENGELRIVSPMVAIRKIQAMVKEHREKHGLTGSVVDEFIAERREAAARGD